MKSLFHTLLFCGVVLIAALAHAQPLHVLWDRSGLTDSSAYGYKILPLGDQNNDGYADWGVLAFGNVASYYGTRASYLEFFHGGNPLPTEPYFTYRTDTTIYAPYFWAVVVGDINGDGYQDWDISVWRHSPPAGYQDLIFFGGPGNHGLPDIEWPMSETVMPIGDFNGDGYDDLIANEYQNPDVWHTYYGGSPIDTLPDWTLHGPPPGINNLAPEAVGDFNGDGASDFLCYNPNSPFNAAIFLGGANPDTVPAYSWTNVHGPIGGVKDLNGDGFDEFILGGDGQEEVHFGRPVLRPEPDAFLHFSCSGGGGAHEAISAGDYNHDGYDDIIMLNDYCPDQQFGSLTLHLGHPWLYSEPAFVIGGWSPPLNLIGIYTATGLGDVNGDGVNDIAIGAWDDYAYLGWRGRCVILAGDTSFHAGARDSRPELAQKLAVSVYPNPFNGEASIRLEAPSSPVPVTLITFNLLGQEVQRAVLPRFTGEYIYRYNAQDLSSGLYLLQVRAGSYQTTQKLMVLR